MARQRPTPSTSDGTQASDDQSGDPLVPALVRKARQEEMKCCWNMRVYERVDVGECMRATGKRPIAVRRVNIDKGD